MGFKTLAFADEFAGPAGSKPSSTSWGFKQFSGPSNSLAYFDGTNQIALDGSGNNVITARRMTDSTGRIFWDTGWMESKVGVTPPLLYETRAKVAPGYGMWSGVAWSWSYPYGTQCGGAADTEQLGRQPQGVNHSIQWCGGTKTKYATLPFVLANDFHIYSTAIYPDRIEYYLDGIKYDTMTAADTSTGTLSDFQRPTSFNISLNIGSCGSWANCPPADAPPTSQIVTDWFRVYTP